MDNYYISVSKTYILAFTSIKNNIKLTKPVCIQYFHLNLTDANFTLY